MNEKLIDFDDYAEVKLTEYLFRLDRVPEECVGITGRKYTWIMPREITCHIYPPLQEYIDTLVALNPARRGVCGSSRWSLNSPQPNTDFILELLKKHTEEAKELLERHIKEEQEKAVDSKQGENG